MKLQTHASQKDCKKIPGCFNRSKFERNILNFKMKKLICYLLIFFLSNYSLSYSIENERNLTENEKSLIENERQSIEHEGNLIESKRKLIENEWN